MSLSISKSLDAPKGIHCFKRKSGSKTLLLSIHSFITKKETPLYASCLGSYTIEAAVILPVFICFIAFAIFFMKILVTQMTIQKVIDKTGQEISILAGIKDDISIEEVRILCNGRIYTEASPLFSVDGGISNIDYSNSELGNNYINIYVSYRISFPLDIFGPLTWDIQQVSSSRKWIGWDPSEGEANGEFVYITKYGQAYHLKSSCPFLRLGIKAVEKKTVGEKRNENGKKYKPCKGCKANQSKNEMVYFTDYGDVYHVSLNCKGLNRSIMRIRIEQVEGRHRCPKCGG